MKTIEDDLNDKNDQILRSHKISCTFIRKQIDQEYKNTVLVGKRG